MRDCTRSRYRSRLLAGALALIGIFVVAAAGCGSDDSESDSGGGNADITEAQAIVDENLAEVGDFSGPTTVRTPPKNKHVLIINCAGASVGCTSQTRSAEEAAKSLGWETTVIDGQGDPNRYNDAIQQGISLGVDGIVLASIDQRLVQDSLRDAKAAGINVVSQWSGNIGPSAEYIGKEDAEPGPNTVEMETPQPDVEAGRAMAAYAITQTDGEAHVLMLTTPEFPNEDAKAKSFRESLAELCPSCEIVDEQKVNQAQATTQVPETVKARLGANPEINVIWVPYDDIGILADQGVRETGRTDDVTIVSTVGIAPGLELICGGESSMKATIAEAPIWPGHASIDALVLLFTGGEVATPELFEEYTTPTRLITEENCSSLSSEGNWNGDYDIPAAWQELWGVN